MLWVIKRVSLNGNSISLDSFTVWASKHDALQSAATNVIEEIRTWDMSELVERVEAREINDLVRSGDYLEAIARYNIAHGNTNSKYARYCYVYEAKEYKFQRDAVLVLDDAFFADPDAEKVQEIQPESTPIPVKVAQPVVVNDHVCVSCGNTACSRAEKACWRCGHHIVP